MSPLEAMRFLLWAQSHRNEGRDLTHIEVANHWRVSRATAYRWLGAYFDAKCWPRRPQPISQMLHAAVKEKANPADHPWRESFAA